LNRRAVCALVQKHVRTDERYCTFRCPHVTKKLIGNSNSELVPQAEFGSGSRFFLHSFCLHSFVGLKHASFIYIMSLICDHLKRIITPGNLRTTVALEFTAARRLGYKFFQQFYELDMSRLYLPLIGLAVTAMIVVASVAAGDGLELQKDLFFAEEGDKISIEKVHRINKAFGVVLKDFEVVESSILKIKSGKPTASAEEQKVITEVTSDVDFIYADLDTIRGSSVVKLKRKAVAEKLNFLSTRIDSLLNLMGQER
jgi:hypothetical protein